MIMLGLDIEPGEVAMVECGDKMYAIACRELATTGHGLPALPAPSSEPSRGRHLCQRELSGVGWVPTGKIRIIQRNNVWEGVDENDDVLIWSPSRDEVEEQVQRIVATAKQQLERRLKY